MTKQIFPKINDNELLILKELAGSFSNSDYGDGPGYWHFSSLVKATNLELKKVRLSCRSLARKGLAEYVRGLWSEDGPAGAGYGATELGAALISPCDICGRLAEFGYKLENGNSVKECEEHYQKSTGTPAK